MSILGECIKMKNIAKLIALLYGCQFVFGGIGMGLYCYMSPDAFSQVANPMGIDLRLFLMTAGLVPQIGLGTLLIWIGLSTRSRQRLWRIAGKAVQGVLDN